MNLWRLEWLRLFRTHRWMILVGVFGLFAVSGPILTAYLEELMSWIGEGIVVQLPPQRPVDAVLSYLDGITQLGMVAVVVVAAAALALDSRPEAAAFLRTRIDTARMLVLPRYAVVTAAVATTMVAGMAVAWLLTAALIGTLAVGPMLLGTLLCLLYLAFAVAVVAAVAGYLRSVVGTVFGSIVVLLALPIVALLRPVRPWLPSELLTAVVELLEGAAVTDYLRAVAVTLVAVPALLALAVHRIGNREV